MSMEMPKQEEKKTPEMVSLENLESALGLTGGTNAENPQLQRDLMNSRALTVEFFPHLKEILTREGSNGKNLEAAELLAKLLEFEIQSGLDSSEITGDNSYHKALERAQSALQSVRETFGLKKIESTIERK